MKDSAHHLLDTASGFWWVRQLQQGKPPVFWCNIILGVPGEILGSLVVSNDDRRELVAEVLPEELKRFQAHIDPAWIEEALEATGTATVRRRPNLNSACRPGTK